MPDSVSNPLVVFRILDANYNRASEGLRVVEDYCRFALNDVHLALQCKQLRHALTAAIAHIPEIRRLAARDSANDVGAELSTPGEAHRESLTAVAGANWGRIEQALRAIEEYAKLISPVVAGEAKALRYQAYTLAKACGTTETSQEWLTDARLYVLIDGAESGATLAQRVAALVAAGVHILQLRDKRLADRELLERARIVRELTAGGTTLFILNDRPDLAVLSQADGVHVGQDELSVADVRRIVGPEALIGVSTHNLQQARQAVLDGANYIGCGPTFPSTTKQFENFPGIAFLQQVAAEIALPAFAIGGLTLDNLPSVLGAGFSRVAMSSAIHEATEPMLAVKTLLSRLTLTPGPASP